MVAESHSPRALRIVTALLFVGLLFSNAARAADTKALRIYLDADRQDHLAAAEAIELGVRTAFHESGNEVAGYPIEIVPLDHRGNVKRSRLNMQRYLDDPRALVLFGGLHSPPYLKYQSFLNDNRILTLLPWSAAGPLTRVASGENWIFRLSVDDARAAQRMVSHAIDTLGCERPALVLWDSGWGRTNEVTLTNALIARGIDDTPVFYFPGSLEQADSDVLASKLTEVKAGCALLVANTREGASVVSSIAALEKPVTVVSHWGITGGDFTDQIDWRTREQVDLHFLQTCYPSGDRVAANTDRVWQLALQTDPELDPQLANLRAPAGFFHGYDLARLLISALAKHPGIDNPPQLRQLIHASLESLSEPVEGLLQQYVQPYQPFTADNPDAHEALGIEDLCMARFNSLDRISILYDQTEEIAQQQ